MNALLALEPSEKAREEVGGKEDGRENHYMAVFFFRMFFRLIYSTYNSCV